MVLESEQIDEQQEDTEQIEQQGNGSGNSEEEEEEEEETPQIRRQQGQIRMVTSSGAEAEQTTDETVSSPAVDGTAHAQLSQQPAAPRSPTAAVPQSPVLAAAAPQSPAAAGAAAAAQQASLEEAKRRQQEAMEKARTEALRLQQEARARAEAARQQHQQAAEQARLQAEQQLKAQQEEAKRQAEERAQQLKAQQQQQQQQQQPMSPSATAKQPTKTTEQPQKQQQPLKPIVAAPASQAAVQQQQKAAAPQPPTVPQQKAVAVAAQSKPTPLPPAAQTRAPPPVVREAQLPEAPSKAILQHAEYTPKLVNATVNKLPPGQEAEEEQLEPNAVPRNPIIEDNAWQVQRRVQPEYQPVEPAKLNATGDFLVESEAKKSIVPEAVGYSKVKWNEFPEEEEKERQSAPKVKAQEWVPEHDVEHHVQKTVYQPGRIGPDPSTGRLWPPPGYGEEEQIEIGKGEKTKCIADNGWIMTNGAEPAEGDEEVGNAPWKGHTRGGDVKGRQWPPPENSVEKEMSKGGRISAQWPPPEQEELEQQRVEILQTHIPVKDKVREWNPRSLFPQYETETTEEGA